MKKISFSIISLFCLLIICACSGYKPIFGSSNLNLKIVDYSITGDKTLGNQIYSKLHNLSKTNENSQDTKKIYILINSTQNKNVTAKNSAGKVLGYRINLSTKIIAKDLSTGDELLNETFSFSLTYKTQDEFFETKKLENRTIEHLVNSTYQDLLIKLTDSLL
tara:strand:+ start:1908 stop:2396 length:489 start_codon:yes stop_codon:yes gene_type:complete